MKNLSNMSKVRLILKHPHLKMMIMMKIKAVIIWETIVAVARDFKEVGLGVRIYRIQILLVPGKIKVVVLEQILQVLNLVFSKQITL